MRAITAKDLVNDLRSLGIASGDTVVVRASLRAIGRVRRSDVVDALCEAVGPEGNVVSLAFTLPTFLRRPDPNSAFSREVPSYAGALPNEMLARADAVRSKHPICSFVALGPKASWLMEGHGPESRPYEPIRRVMEIGGKMLLIGCVDTSPGFTTAHLAEYDVGLHKRTIMPWLSSIWYVGDDGEKHLFRPRDSGLCSMSYTKFYSPHVAQGLLQTGVVGQAYSVWVPAREAYAIEREILNAEPRFNVCGNPDCFTCNMQRWDRLHRVPIWLVRNLPRLLRRLVLSRGAA